MKKVFLVFLILISQAFATSQTSFLLKGFVRPSTKIQFLSPTQTYFDLSQNSVDLKGLSFAHFTTQTNAFSGYMIFISSENGGSLRDGSSVKVPYFALHNSEVVELSRVSKMIYKSSVRSKNGKMEPDVKDHIFQLQFPNQAFSLLPPQKSGALQDTVTLSIVAN